MNSLFVATYLAQDILGVTHPNIGHKENIANNFALKTLLLSASSDLGISITSSPSMSSSTRSLSDDTMPFGWHNSFLDSYSKISISLANLWEKWENGTKWNSNAKTEQWYKHGTVMQKRNSGTKTHCSVFVPLFLFKKKRNSSAKPHCSIVPSEKQQQNISSKNGTVVKKHTEQWKKHTVPSCSAVSYEKTEQ